MLADPDLQNHMMQVGAIATYGSADTMKAPLHAEHARWDHVAIDIDFDIWNA